MVFTFYSRGFSPLVLHPPPSFKLYGERTSKRICGERTSKRSDKREQARDSMDLWREKKQEILWMENKQAIRNCGVYMRSIINLAYQMTVYTALFTSFGLLR
ncbi:hypothetical protein AMTRI_Chr13g121780 [Amborella trichopoda]